MRRTNRIDEANDHCKPHAATGALLDDRRQPDRAAVLTAIRNLSTCLQLNCDSHGHGVADCFRKFVAVGLGYEVLDATERLELTCEGLA